MALDILRIHIYLITKVVSFYLRRDCSISLHAGMYHIKKTKSMIYDKLLRAIYALRGMCVLYMYECGECVEYNRLQIMYYAFQGYQDL